MGVVYRGYDPALDRRVALKVLRARADAGDTGGTARLAREAQAMARLAHPNVVPVYDVGRQGESLFVAMEFVVGATLQAWLAEKPRPWREVVDICVQAGRGLEAAHAAGIIHRDFKPANVLVGKDGRARVTDFGLARSSGDVDRPSTPIAAGAISLGTPLTVAGAVMGTPGYMAPEQYVGEASTAATDQYAFCATLYEALYGQRPFVANDLQTMAKLAQAGEVPSPPKGSTAPGWLFPIITRGLSSTPAQRHPSMGALLELLQKDPSERRRRWAIVTGAAVLTVAVGVAVWVWPLVRASGCHRETERLGTVWTAEVQERAERAFKATRLPFAGVAWQFVHTNLDGFSQRWRSQRHRACDDTLLRQRSSERDLDLRLACLENRRVELQTLVREFEAADGTVVTQAAAAVTRLTTVDRCANVELLQQRARLDESSRARAEAIEQEVSAGRMLVALGRFAEAGRVLSSAAVEAEALGDSQTLAQTLLEVGHLAGQEYRYADAQPPLDTAIRLALAAGDDRTALHALGLLTSLVGWRLKQPREALALANVGRGLVPRVGDPVLEAILDEGEGDTRWQLDDLPGALAAYRSALERLQQTQGDTGLNVARIKVSIAWVLSEQGHEEEARVACEEGRRLQEELLGVDHPALAMTWSTLAQIADELDDQQAALAATRRAYELRLPWGPDAPITARAGLNLARQLARAGHHEEAHRFHASAARVLSPDSSVRYNVERNRALLLLEKGDLSAAQTAARESLRALTADEGSSIAHAEVLLGVIEAARGEDATAQALFERAFPVLEKAGLNRAREYWVARLELAKLLVRRQPAESGPMVEKALEGVLQLEGNTRLKAEALLVAARTRWARHASSEARQAAARSITFAVEPDQASLKAEAERFLAEHPLE